MTEILVVDAPLHEVRDFLADGSGETFSLERRSATVGPFALSRRGEAATYETVVYVAQTIALGAAGSATNDLLKQAAKTLISRFGKHRVREERDIDETALLTHGDVRDDGKDDNA